MWNLEHSTVVTVTPLVSFLKDKVVKLSNAGLKVFAIVAGEKEGFGKVLHVLHQSAIVRLRIFLSLLLKEFKTTGNVLFLGKLKDISKYHRIDKWVQMRSRPLFISPINNK